MVTWAEKGGEQDKRQGDAVYSQQIAQAVARQPGMVFNKLKPWQSRRESPVEGQGEDKGHGEDNQAQPAALSSPLTKTSRPAPGSADTMIRLRTGKARIVDLVEYWQEGFIRVLRPGGYPSRIIGKDYRGQQGRSRANTVQGLAGANW